MPPDLAALVAALLAVVGVVGIVVPVLPGSITVVAALLVWAVWGDSPAGWLVFAFGVVALGFGMVSSYVLTQRNLRARQVPQWPITVSLLVGVVAGFFLPVVGLVLGFVLSLLLLEWWRVKDFPKAVSTSGAALRSVGLGILVELGCALVASTALAVSIIVSVL